MIFLPRELAKLPQEDINTKLATANLSHTNIGLVKMYKCFPKLPLVYFCILHVHLKPQQAGEKENELMWNQDENSGLIIVVFLDTQKSEREDNKVTGSDDWFIADGWNAVAIRRTPSQWGHAKKNGMFKGPDKLKTVTHPFSIVYECRF